MNKLLLSAASLVVMSSVTAFAADLPSIKSAPVVAPAPMWTGFYAGLNAGGTWGNNTNIIASTYTLVPDAGSKNLIDAALLTGNAGNLAVSPSFIGGGQIGYNWQAYQNFVIGGEADIQGIAGNGSNGNRWTAGQDLSSNIGLFDNATSTALANQKVSGSLNWFGTVRGRIGYLVLPNLLVYATGGLAYGGSSANVSNYQNYSSASTIAQLNGIYGVTYGQVSSSNTSVGYSAGGGLEWMFLPNWSVKAEYLYYNLGNISGSVTNIFHPTGFATTGGSIRIESITTYHSNIAGNIVRAGINYHFNFANVAPVVAKF
jgi:outer membrane immunogenic protein